MNRLLRTTLVGLLILAGVLTALVYSLTWRPADKQTLPVSCVAPRAPTLLREPGFHALEDRLTEALIPNAYGEPARIQPIA